MREIYDNDFYEEVGDVLSPFRRTYAGAIIEKDNIDPFSKDPDSLQSEHEEQLKEKQSNNLNL